ncbi:MAG: LysM peptidoglycan-binding domain-containing protein [Chitinophagales bacterium]|nr:LysM peptidoglycan-binding domain-containing protein [Chitinophagales bacterium]
MTKLIYSLVLLMLMVNRFSALAQSVDLNHARAKSAAYDFHVVTKGETLYSIARAYQTSTDELLRLNPEISGGNLPIGTELKIPLVKTSMNPETGYKLLQPVYYTVLKKETLYSISKRYNTTVDSLISWNNLHDAAIEENSKLIVGFESMPFSLEGPLNVSGQPATLKQDTTRIHTNLEHGKSVDGINGFPDELAQKGIATWVKSGDDGGDFFALHATVPKGTMIKVKNVMNGRVVEVKVIGKLPSTSVNEDVLIKISASAAGQLGVLDDRFLAAIYYEDMQEHSKDEVINTDK